MDNYYYEKIKGFYGETKAEHSGLPYIRHIDQGLQILDRLGSSNLTKAAFCIHPLVQENPTLITAIKLGFLNDCNATVVMVAMEYRAVANSYLSHHPLNLKVNLGPLDEVRQMLIADKVQNYNDLIYHNTNHPNFIHLRRYFYSWLAILGITQDMYDELARGLK